MYEYRWRAIGKVYDKAADNSIQAELRELVKGGGAPEYRTKQYLWRYKKNNTCDHCTKILYIYITLSRLLPFLKSESKVERSIFTNNNQQKLFGFLVTNLEQTLPTSIKGHKNVSNTPSFRSNKYCYSYHFIAL